MMMQEAQCFAIILTAFPHHFQDVSTEVELGRVQAGDLRELDNQVFLPRMQVITLKTTNKPIMFDQLLVLSRKASRVLC